MHYAGIDLHRRFLVVCIENDEGETGPAWTFKCEETVKMVRFFQKHKPFVAVIESSTSYRWLYELLSPYGKVLLAHPKRMRAIVSGRAKTDKIDAALLAKLLRIGVIPEAYVPPARYQVLRELTRSRTKLVRERSKAKNALHALMARANYRSPFKTKLCKSSLKVIQEVDFGECTNYVRDELMRRIDHFNGEVKFMDERINEIADRYPEIESLIDIRGIGIYSALLIIGELGEITRFKNKNQVASYAGLTAKVNQSGDHNYYGHITRQGSPWLRYVLVTAAMKVTSEDKKLFNFYTRIRKRASAKIARVAVARKLATICWVRLKNWQRERKQAA